MSNPAFDAHIFDCYATLLAGATLISAPRDTFADPTAFTTLIRDERITLSYIPPAILALLDPAQLTDTDLRARLGRRRSPTRPNKPPAGPGPGSSCTTPTAPPKPPSWSPTTYAPPQPLPGSTPIGTALPNHRAYALDQRLHPAPIGVPGQLYIAGTGVTYGYHHQPALTANTLPTRPLRRPRPAHRMYATGDLVRWHPDGQLEFLGRRDRQVQLRGQRIELGEIEHTLTQHPDIHQSAVLIHDGALVAYLAGDVDPDDVRQYLADRLPTYMIPTTLITLPALPLTPNGKLDTARLPDPTPPGRRRTSRHAPTTERWLADTWQDLLGVDQVGATDNFFDLGGNSLHATQLVARVRDQLTASDLHPRHLFTNPTLEQLAARLDRAETAAAESPIAPVARAGSLPCTYQQEGLWFQHQLDPRRRSYHIGLALRLRGRLDVDALARAVHTLVVRHEALRTRFVEQDGLPRQVVDPPPPATAPLSIVDIEASNTFDFKF